MLALKMSLLALSNLIPRIQSAMLTHPSPTTFARPLPDAENGWSPRPTSAADHYGAMLNDNLFARQQSAGLNENTCGWYSGDVASPVTCGRVGTLDSSCAYTINPTGGMDNFFCCPVDRDGRYTARCPYISDCRNYRDRTDSDTERSVVLQITSADIIAW